MVLYEPDQETVLTTASIGYPFSLRCEPQIDAGTAYPVFRAIPVADRFFRPTVYIPGATTKPSKLFGFLMNCRRTAKQYLQKPGLPS